MPVDFNPMLFNYPLRENLARFFGFKVGLGLLKRLVITLNPLYNKE
jgi:hypothetical protein